MDLHVKGCLVFIPYRQLDSFQRKGEERGKSMLPVEANNVELCSQELLGKHF